ncbi:MAG: zinc ABC transporter substrate-binding protein, partial [Actinomycetales bacterium]
VALALSGCAGGETTSPAGTEEKLNVVVAFYPLQYLAETIGSDAVQVINLTTPGTEPHDLELAPKQVASLSKADLVIYQKGFQSQVDDAIEQQNPKNIIDVAELVELIPFDKKGHGHDGDHEKHKGKEGHKKDHEQHHHGAFDPHIWQDPTNMVKIANEIGTKIAELKKSDADQILAATKKLTADLNKLDEDYKIGLSNCKTKEFITSHAAFGYLAKRYGLHQIGISGLSPEAEPSPARIAEIHKLAKKHQVSTIFYETLASPAVAKSIAGDLGLKTDVLDPLEGLNKDSLGKNYLEIMQSNLKALKTANGCS